MRPVVAYNSHGTADLYAMIADVAGDRFELLTLDNDEEGERLAKLARSDAVIVAATPLTRPRIAAARRLRFVHHQGVGYQDTIDLAALAETGVPLAITPAGTTTGVAEHTILLILSVLKRLPFADSELRAGRWHINALRPVSYELSGKTVGLVGMGRIGQGTAERLAPFGVRVLYYDPVALPAEREQALGARRRTLPDLLAESDIVSLHLPLTPATRHLVDAAALARMKPSAFLVNTSRGGLVDESALIAALAAGRLAGAALDVFESEPPKPDNPLLGMPNVVLTPHIAAGTRDAFQTKMRALFDNLDAFFSGRPVENLVDYAAGLRRG